MKQPLRVAVMDDHPVVVSGISYILCQAGHVALPAPSLQRELPSWLREERIDAITLDIGMPAVNGLQVAQQIRSSLPQLIIIATGSEVTLALQARERLEAEGTKTRVVSMPCQEWFEAQDAAYRDTVLPPIVKARVSVEAGVKQGWRDYVGDQGRIISIERYGASADYARIYQELGVTATAVARPASWVSEIAISPIPCRSASDRSAPASRTSG